MRVNPDAGRVGRRLAKTGTTVSLAHKPQLVPKSKSESAGAHLQIKLNMLDVGFTTEEQEVAFHGSTFTHIDGSAMATTTARSTTDIR